jgi:hypothetical protein
MRFINYKIRLAFTKIFGSAENPEILMNFLNAIVYEGQPNESRERARLQYDRSQIS